MQQQHLMHFTLLIFLGVKVEDLYKKLEAARLRSPRFDLWWKADIPERFHHKNNKRIGPIFFLEHLGYVFYSGKDGYCKFKHALLHFCTALHFTSTSLYTLLIILLTITLHSYTHHSIHSYFTLFIFSPIPHFRSPRLLERLQRNASGIFRLRAGVQDKSHHRLGNRKCRPVQSHGGRHSSGTGVERWKFFQSVSAV